MVGGRAQGAVKGVHAGDVSRVAFVERLRMGRVKDGCVVPTEGESSVDEGGASGLKGGHLTPV